MQRSTKWTVLENKLFENALAMYNTETPDRWQKVAAAVSGKTVADVINQYIVLEADVSSIEAGLVPVSGYVTSSPPFTLDCSRSGGSGGKRSAVFRPPEPERKKGVPWTVEEHKLFLMGLKKYGKGDWRNISRNFVTSRTPSQVASHAQKYFLRQQLSGSKGKSKSQHSRHHNGQPRRRTTFR